MAYEIEKGVPVPPRPGGNGRPAKYPFADLDVGDSFLVVGREAKAVQAAASKSGKRHGRRYCGRTVDGGIRIWRIE